MKKNKKVEEYEALYGSIPEEYTTRILSLMRELKINSKDLDNIRLGIKRIRGIKTYKIDFNISDNAKIITPWEPEKANEIKEPVADDCKLPAMVGRNYLAKANASVKMEDGSVIVGTKDMMLAKIKDGKVKNLGAVTTCGSVNSLVCTGDTVYGIAGYEKGAANMFKYDDENGVEQLGYVPTAYADNRRNVCIFNATTMALSPDKNRIAIGGADELSGVIIIKLS